MASDRHCLASVEKGAPNHDGVMVGCTENSDGRGWGWGVRRPELPSCDSSEILNMPGNVEYTEGGVQTSWRFGGSCKPPGGTGRNPGAQICE